ncbi:ArnT family glycosyltransferase [Thiomicrospira pelophila]|uniref:ArnT family glycosyltransferase n=1 Tax=Thiomicrospira pelophila TaxID=934 RepID=UPI0004A6DBC4|nr:glycosyltransferase family 39 protein [Thiomicrospira pelophila]
MTSSDQTPSLQSKIESFLIGENQTKLVLLVFFTLIMIFLYLWPAFYLPLFDMDEGAYAAVSREMVLSGQWWATMLNGEPFFHKPVLMYWLQSIGLGLVGDGNLAYRLPSLVALGIWLWVTFKFLQRHVDHQTAWLSIWIGFFSAGMAVIFKAAIPDAWLILFISLAMYKALDFLTSQRESDLNWAFIWTGFGILAKGPIALVVVAGALFVHLVIGRKWITLKQMILAWKGWLLLILIALPWYVLQVALFGQDFINEFFGVHNVGRFMNPMEGHSGNPLYYIVALVFLTLPFFPLLIQAMRPWWNWSKQSSLWQVMGIWFLLVLVFFTLAATKLPHYLMYGVPPVIIAMAYFVRQNGTRWGLGLTLLIVAAFLASVPWLIEWLMASEKNPYLVETYGQATQYITAGYFSWMAFLAIAGLLLFWVKWGTATKVVMAGVVMTLVLNYAVLNYAAELQQKPIVEAANYVKANELEVVTCCIEMPSFNVVAEQLTPMRMPKSGEIVFGKTDVLQRKFKELEWVWQGRGVALAKVIEE